MVIAKAYLQTLNDFVQHNKLLSVFQVASRSLNETCGTDLKVQFLSNAPIAVMKKYKNTSNKASLIQV